MLMSMSNPDVPQQINAVRARKPFSNFIDIKYFFRNMDVSAPPKVSSEQTDGVSRHLKLGLSYVFDELADPKNEPVQQTGSVFYVNTLEMNFDITNGAATQNYKSWLCVNPQGLVVNKKSAEGYMETPCTPRKKLGFNLRIGEQSFAYRDSIVCVYANGRYPAIYSLLRRHPFPAQTACNLL